MAVTQPNLTNQLLEEAALLIYNNYSYFGTGTGTVPIVDGATQLTAGVTVQSGSFNKSREGGNIGSFLNGRIITVLATLEPGEPVTQPIVQGEVGLFKSSAAGSLGMGAKLNVPQTKDNMVKQRWRITLKFARLTEV